MEEKREMTAIGLTVITLEHKNQWQRDDMGRHKCCVKKTAVTSPLQALSPEYDLWEDCGKDMFSQK